MKSTINERIASIISKFGYKSKRAFAEKIGVAQTSLNDVLNGAEPKFSTLNKILKAEPLISAEWLMRGVGDMKMKNQQDYEISDDSIVYHYTNLKGLFGIIGYEQLNLSELAYTNDLRENNNKSGYKCICFCIGENAYKKPRMWAQYGDNHKGVCIGFRLGKLKEGIKKNSQDCREVEGFKVQYLDEDSLRYEGCERKESLYFKLKDWENENEYRFISKETDFIPISKDCIESIYIGVKNTSDFDAITKIGMNDKLKTFMMVGGLLKEHFMNAFTQKISFGEDIDMNGLKVKVASFVDMEDVDVVIGRRNARKYFEEIGNMREYTHIPANKYEDIIRENERLRIENEHLKKEATGASTNLDAQDVVEVRKEA